MKTLSPRLHTKVNVTRNIDPGFTSGTVILHFHSPFKPWKPLSPAEVVMLTEKKRWPMLPFYRTVWLDYASRVEGFADFCDQQPYTAIEIMCLANTVLLVEKKMIASMRLEEAAQSPS